MAKITFLLHAGDEQSVDAAVGVSIMEAAVINDVEGITAECGGNAMCATCHVYVDEPHFSLLPPREELEEGMLEFTAAPCTEASRLSCQLRMTAELDGVRIRLPERQS